MPRIITLASVFLLLFAATMSADAQHPPANNNVITLPSAIDRSDPLQDDADPPIPPGEDETGSQQNFIDLVSSVRDLLDQVFGIPDNENLNGDVGVEDAAREEVTIEETPEQAPVTQEQANEANASFAKLVDESTGAVEDQGQEVLDGRERTLQKMDELIAHAQEMAAERESELAAPGSVPAVEELTAKDGESLLEQVQQMLDEIGTGQSGEETADTRAAGEGEEQAFAQWWMPTTPDCDAPPGPMVNWSYCDKSGIDLEAVDLSDAVLVETNFSDAYLNNVDLSGANMHKANFSSAILETVVMRKSNIREADFSLGSIFTTDMSYVDASHAIFNNARLVFILGLHSKFVEADFSNAIYIFNDLSYSDLHGANFSAGEPQFNFFRGSNMEGVDFSFLQADTTDMTGARIEGMDVSGTTLSTVWFKNAAGVPAPSTVDVGATAFVCPDGTYNAGPTTTDAHSLCVWDVAPLPPPATAAVVPDPCDEPPAPGVDWSGCDKTALATPGLDLRNANLQGTIFTGADMFMWDLSGADLSGAIIDGAAITFSSFRDANLSNAILDNAEILYSDFTAAEMFQASFVGLFTDFNTLRKSNLEQAVLDDVLLSLIDLGYSNLKDASLGQTQIDGVYMHGANLSGAQLPLASLFYVQMLGAQIEGTDLTSSQLGRSIWLKHARGVPTSSQDLSLEGTLICPAGDSIQGPLTTDAASLCEWTPCWDVVMNGAFHGDEYWYLPATEYPAALTMDQAHSTEYSVRTGIIEPHDNVYSFSSVRQKVTLPAGTKTAILSFYLYPQTDEPVNYLIPNSVEEAMSIRGAMSAMGSHGSYVGDAQWVIIYDSMGHELMRPISMRSNSQTWEYHEVDLHKLVHPHKDVTVELYIGSFNNGHAGVTGMYVDDVTLGNCNDIPKPPPPEPPPVVCEDTITNGGFETQDSSWLLPLTPYPAGYSEEQVNNGAWSMRTGINDDVKNVKNFSSALQRVAIPADATSADLKFYLYPQSTEDYKMIIPESINTVLAQGSRAMNYGDAQWVLILNKRGKELARLVSMRSNEQTWREYEFDLIRYKGETILVYFGSFNNGWDGRTVMFIDDVTLDVCTPEEG